MGSRSITHVAIKTVRTTTANILRETFALALKILSNRAMFIDLNNNKTGGSYVRRMKKKRIAALPAL
jgi:hypothetical protein